VMSMVYVASLVCLVRRSAAVLPDVRCRPGWCRGRAMMALVSPSRRSPGRCPQWRQRVLAATWPRTRPRTAVNGMRRGSGPASAAARAVAVQYPQLRVTPV
jgi:hypothetical protein